jgi:hypothetical protein
MKLDNHARPKRRGFAGLNKRDFEIPWIFATHCCLERDEKSARGEQRRFL